MATGHDNKSTTGSTESQEEDAGNFVEHEAGIELNPLQLLYNSVVNNDLGLYKTTLSMEGVDFSNQNVVPTLGNKLLHLICLSKKEENVTDYLSEAINHGCDIRAKNYEDNMPIHVACSVGNHRAVQYLIDHDNTLVKELGEHHRTPLMVVISCFSTEKSDDIVKVVNILIKAGSDVNIESQYHSHSPLLMAVFNDEKAGIVRLLLNAGADVNKRSLLGRTPLLQAVSQNNQQVVQCLLDANSDPNTKDSMGQTPLLLATHKKYKDIIRDLVRYGADVNCEFGANNKNVLSAAIQTSDTEVTKLLFELGLRLTPDIILTENPLCQAIKQKCVDNIKILLRENCPFNEPLHEMPLLTAVESNYVVAGVLDILIKAGANFSDALLSYAVSVKPGDESLADVVRCYHSEVRTLKSLCCFSVRNCLGLNIQNKLQCLAEGNILPRTLVPFLMLEHVLGI